MGGPHPNLVGGDKTVVFYFFFFFLCLKKKTPHLRKKGSVGYLQGLETAKSLISVNNSQEYGLFSKATFHLLGGGQSGHNILPKKQ